MPQNWDQSKFEALVKEQLHRHSSETWPKTLNKHMFFVTLDAFKRTSFTTNPKIESELGREVMARRQNNTQAMAPMGYVLAAKRAAKTYGTSERFLKQVNRELASESGGRGKGPNYRAAWLGYIKDKFRSMIGGRKSSEQFLRAGFVSILYKLGPIIGYARPSTGKDHTRGAIKGSVLHLAAPGDYSITIENRAHSLTEHRGGFERIGGKALQEAFDSQTVNLQKHLDDEMKPHVEKFNREA